MRQNGVRSKDCYRNPLRSIAKVVALPWLIAVGIAGRPVAAQDIAGTWQGTIQAGKEQRMVVKIAKDGGGWKGVVYNLDGDMAYEGRVTTQLSVQGGELRLAIAPIDVTYQGKLSADGQTIAGTWTQGGQAHPLNLVRATGDAVWEIPKADVAMVADADPDWDVSTVRPSDPDDHSAGFQLHGRQIFIERMTVESMLLMSYGAHKKQIVGAPDWIETERWDVKGVPDVPGQPSVKQYQSMVRKLLAERFGLVTHTEKREMEVYALTVAKGGEKMTPSAGDPNGLLNENDHDSGGQRTMEMTNGSMADFALIMKFFLDRPVVDQTGLQGKYDFRLQWTYDESRVPTDGTAAPSVFTAVQEQLGLKLEPVKAMTDVMVVDKLERPSAN